MNKFPANVFVLLYRCIWSRHSSLSLLWNIYLGSCFSRWMDGLLITVGGMSVTKQVPLYV